MRYLAYIATLVFTFSFGRMNAQQSTFTGIYNIFQAKCANSACHDADSPAGLLNLTGTEQEVYDRLTGATSPTNPAAASKGMKWVDKGHPYNSFLLKKLGSSFDSFLELEAAEGSQMPLQAPALSDIEIETIRQWIIEGAPMNGQAVDEQLITEYYTDGGIEFFEPPAAPDPSEGFQVRFGPIFLKPGSSGDGEVEYLKKHDLRLPYDIEVYRMDGFMNWQSHHFLLFRFDEGKQDDEADGLRKVDLFSGVTPYDGDKELIGAWQISGEFELPEGTALFVDQDAWFDLDYHVINYSQDDILPADFYLNIYYDERGTGKTEMLAELETNPLLLLFEGENVRTNNHRPGGDDRNIWMMSSHTHKYGTDYDIYIRNPDGSKGEQIYEGFYNQDYSFNQGFYDWEHPAIRYWDPFKTFNAEDGLIYEVKWDVQQPFVTFGLTSNDEMMLFTYLYTKGENVASSIEEISPGEVNAEIYPNPFGNKAVLSYDLPQSAQVNIEIVDLLGARVGVLADEYLQSGSYLFGIDRNELNLNDGVYFVRMTVGNTKSTIKFIVN